MTYASESDLENKIGPDRLAALLADESGVEIGGRLDAALAAADDEIDSALGNAYATPFASPYPSCVTRWAAAITLGILITDRGNAGPLKDGADAARTEIADVADGRRRIPAVGRGDAVGGITEADRTFTEESTDVW